MTPPTPDDVTLGEIFRGLNALREEMRGRFDGLSFVSREVYDRDMADLKADVKELKDSKQWMFRALIVSLILPLIVAAFVALVVR